MRGLKIDHLVINIEEKYQTDVNEIQAIRKFGLPYEPKWGKGTKGFKASNIWIGKEYFEMIRLLKNDGGGWKSDWVERYNQGHRGLICLMLDVSDLDQIYEDMTNASVCMTEPEYLRFKWGFGLFTKTMPWRNSYFPFFEGVPFQIGLQQMKDEKSTKMMRQYMVPNATDNGFYGIKQVTMQGAFTASDFALIRKIFKKVASIPNGLNVPLTHKQQLSFLYADDFSVTVTLFSNQEKKTAINIENITVSTRG